MSKDNVLKMIKDEEAAYVDIRFTDPRGKLQHVTVMSDLVDEDFLDEGFMFDGSSIAGWKGIEASDMKLMPDTESAYVDPFYAEKTICLHCSILEPDTGEPYNRDPRGTAQLAAWIGEADVDIGRILVLDHFKYVLFAHRDLPLAFWSDPRAAARMG
jgi:glutamine synthetase